MKIGIVTIAHGANYGNRLQNYAMQEVLKTLGHTVETISYGEINKISTKRLFIHLIKAKILKQKIYKLIKYDRFYLFNKKMIKFSKERYIHNKNFNTSSYDCFVAGSDQVWNLHFREIEDFKDFMFLTFVPRGKKIAYSASIGTDTVPVQYRDFFKKSIKEFSSISVRETTGANAIEELCKMQVETTIDPTFMLSYKKWKKFLKKPKKIPHKNYLAVYFISELSENVKKYINNIAKEYNFEIVTLQPNCYSWTQILDENYFSTDPQEFVYYIAHAKAVITDSFHACAFSTIFKKPFRVFERKDLNMNSRMQELFDKIHLGKWCIGNTEESLEKLLEVDYTGVDEAIVNEQQKALNYLKNALKL